MKKEESLFKSKWVEVLRRDGWFEFSRNTHGDGVAVLCYKIKKFGDFPDVLIRIENNPAHGGFIHTSVTGTIEENETPAETAIKEVKEETGYTITSEDMRYLGYVYPSKFSDYKQHLFAANLKGKKQGDIKGDGTFGEQGASVVWKPFKKAVEMSNCPSVGLSLIKLVLGIMEENDAEKANQLTNN